MSSLQLTATILNIVTHLPLSIWPVEAGGHALQGFSNPQVPSQWMAMESLEDKPLHLLVSAELGTMRSPFHHKS